MWGAVVGLRRAEQLQEGRKWQRWSQRNNSSLFLLACLTRLRNRVPRCFFPSGEIEGQDAAEPMYVGEMDEESRLAATGLASKSLRAARPQAESPCKSWSHGTRSEAQEA